MLPVEVEAAKAVRPASFLTHPYHPPTLRQVFGNRGGVMFVERRKKSREGDRLTNLTEEIRRTEKTVVVEPEIPEVAEDKRETAKASRIGIDFSASILVCAFLGGLADHLWGTSPRLMIVMLVVGFVVGLVSVWRALNGYGHAVGFKKQRTGDGKKKP